MQMTSDNGALLLSELVTCYEFAPRIVIKPGKITVRDGTTKINPAKVSNNRTPYMVDKVDARPAMGPLLMSWIARDGRVIFDVKLRYTGYNTVQPELTDFLEYQRTKSTGWFRSHTLEDEIDGNPFTVQVPVTQKDLMTMSYKAFMRHDLTMAEVARINDRHRDLGFTAVSNDTIGWIDALRADALAAEHILTLQKYGLNSAIDDELIRKFVSIAEEVKGRLDSVRSLVDRQTLGIEIYKDIVVAGLRLAPLDSSSYSFENPAALGSWIKAD